MKVVINDDYGGFSLSEKAVEWLKSNGLDFNAYGPLDRDFSSHLDWRAHPVLVQIVEALGKEANGEHASLKVVEIPDDVKWVISDYDGLEHVAEQHRVWY